MIFSEKDKKYMEYCLLLASEAEKSGEVPVGACLVKNGILIGSGYNRSKSAADSTAHAEMIAIREACHYLQTDRLEDATLYVTLEPCSMCASAAVIAKIGRIVFGAFDPKAGACGSLYNIAEDKRLNHNPLVYSGLMEEECSKILKDFFRQKRNGT